MQGKICKKSGRIYFQSNTVTDRKFHFQVKSVVRESCTRITHKRLSSPEKNSIVDRILQSKCREKHNGVESDRNEKNTVGNMLLKRNILGEVHKNLVITAVTK